MIVSRCKSYVRKHLFQIFITFENLIKKKKSLLNNVRLLSL